jgi:hypothetical protein
MMQLETCYYWTHKSTSFADSDKSVIKLAQYMGIDGRNVNHKLTFAMCVQQVGWRYDPENSLEHALGH